MFILGEYLFLMTYLSKSSTTFIT